MGGLVVLCSLLFIAHASVVANTRPVEHSSIRVVEYSSIRVFEYSSIRVFEYSSNRVVQQAPVRIDLGRFTFLSYPADSLLAFSLITLAARSDTFPGLPRPTRRVLIAIAPDAKTFREWIGPNAPEWGAAVAFPGLDRIVMQGAWAGSKAGDHRVVLRHEVAHLALHEFQGEDPPRWFDEGYASFAAGEWKRTDAFAANFLLIFRGSPPLDSLDRFFSEGESRAQAAYALSHVAIENLAALDKERGLALFFQHWRESRSLDQAVRRSYGITLSGFEERWKKSISRRFGVIAVVADLGVLSLFLILLLGPFFIRRRRLLRARLASLKKTESAAEQRAVSDALSDLLRDPSKGDEERRQ